MVYVMIFHSAGALKLSVYPFFVQQYTKMPRAVVLRKSCLMNGVQGRFSVPQLYCRVSATASVSRALLFSFAASLNAPCIPAFLCAASLAANGPEPCDLFARACGDCQRRLLWHTELKLTSAALAAADLASSPVPELPSVCPGPPTFGGGFAMTGGWACDCTGRGA